MTKSLLETNVTVLMDLTNNVNVVLNLGWIPTGKYRTLELFSKKYYLKCDLMKQQIEIYQNEKLNKVIKPKFEEPLKLMGETHYEIPLKLLGQLFLTYKDRYCFLMI